METFILEVNSVSFLLAMKEMSFSVLPDILPHSSGRNIVLE
jgi:hypothetical protein